MNAAYRPEQVIPIEIAEAIAGIPSWFVIGGQAVRCFSPYRPSRDVDFGVEHPDTIQTLIAQLKATGEVQILQQDQDTVHLRWNGLDVSIFHLPSLVPFVQENRLTTTGILATKLHAILDRGTRRDFFDLYVTMQQQQLGVGECLRAMQEVYGGHVNNGLLLRALCYFEDADREATLPNEGANDWKTVKDFLARRVGDLLIPPNRKLKIQSIIVDARP